MRIRIQVAALAAAMALVLALVTPTRGGEPVDPAELQKRWMEACKPGENHKWLERFVGKWKLTTKVWMGPGEPMTTEGSYECQWAVPGKWLRSEGQAVMMGIPFRFFETLGYDNFKRKFVATRVDSVSTALYAAEGFRDREGKQLDLYGTIDEPTTGEHDKPVLYRYRFVDDATIVLEVHDLAIVGGETRVIEFTMKRA